MWLENKAYLHLKCGDINWCWEFLFYNREHLNAGFWKPELSAADEVMIESFGADEQPCQAV